MMSDLLSLTVRACRYEVTGSKDARLYRFCGEEAVKDRPYCACHMRKTHYLPNGWKGPRPTWAEEISEVVEIMETSDAQ